MTMTDVNPLLSPSTLPNGAPPFDLIGEEHYLPAVEAAIGEARAEIAAIKTNEATPDFANTIVALETSSETLGYVTSIFYNLLSAVGGDGLQVLAERIGPVSAAFSSDVSLDADLFTKVKAVYDGSDALALSREQEMLLEETYLGFVRSGALLDDAGQARMREIAQRMSVLGPMFMNNVTKSADLFELWITDPAELAGLPDSALSALRAAAEEKQRPDEWLVTLDMPSYAPFVQFADNRALREKVWRGFASRAWGGEFDNAALVLEIVSLRNERARLLGFANHAAFTLERRMARKAETVLDFLETLKAAYRPAALRDLDRLQEFARLTGGPDPLQPWDVGYYAEKMRQSLFAFTSEDFRPYYPLATVLGGCFEHFSKLFGLRFTANPAYQVWHPDVTAYDVTDDTDGRFIGTLYADFYPRTGKKDGAWMTSFRNQGLFRGQVERPVVAIVCNFTKPTRDRPALLIHGEVETLFHEMGHAVHGLLSDVTYPSLSGTNVLWDFVELPSQVQENWTYHKETLDLLTGHYQTGAKIPQDLIDKLNAAKNFMVGWAGLRQTGFALMDMAWHTADMDAVTDVAAFEDEATKGTALFPRLAGPMSASFSHLFAGGYGAGYYSYKWAEVLDADTFELFQERGLYDRATADAYRGEVLSRGGSEHPATLYNRFRGRDPDPQALLRREGLLTPAAG